MSTTTPAPHFDRADLDAVRKFLATGRDEPAARPVRPTPPAAPKDVVVHQGIARARLRSRDSRVQG